MVTKATDKKGSRSGKDGMGQKTHTHFQRPRQRALSHTLPLPGVTGPPGRVNKESRGNVEEIRQVNVKVMVKNINIAQKAKAEKDAIKILKISYLLFNQ